MRLFVGNLPYTSDEEELREIFGNHGHIKDVKVIRDRDTNRSRGFGFVEMDDDAALTAIEQLDGTELHGRTINVNKARKREDRRDR